MQASEKLEEAAKILATRGQGIQLRQLQTLDEIAGEKNSTIEFPVPVDLLNKRRGLGK